MFTRYHIIRNKKELKQLVKACEYTGIASVDFETNASPIYTKEFKPTILSVSFQAGSGCSIPLQHFDESLEFLQKNNSTDIPCNLHFHICIICNDQPGTFYLNLIFLGEKQDAGILISSYAFIIFDKYLPGAVKGQYRFPVRQVFGDIQRIPDPSCKISQLSFHSVCLPFMVLITAYDRFPGKITSEKSG